MPNALDRLTHRLMLLRGYRAERVPTPAGQVAALSWDHGGPLPPLTLLHGWASAGVHHALVARRLRRRVRRLVLPDLPGHGFSDAPAPMTPTLVADGVRTALDELQPEPSVILGSSFGGLAAVRYALERPERVAGLVLVSPFGAPMAEYELTAFADLLRARTWRDTKRFLDRLAPRPQRRNWLFTPEMHRILDRPPLQQLLDHVHATPLLTPEERDRLTVPITVVWGRHEALLPAHHLEFWAGLPDVRIVQPDASGHSPSLDEPGAFVRTVVTHLEAVQHAPQPSGAQAAE